MWIKVDDPKVLNSADLETQNASLTFTNTKGEVIFTGDGVVGELRNLGYIKDKNQLIPTEAVFIGVAVLLLLMLIFKSMTIKK